ncbi:hypothetical protein [Catellatospora citrea]|uniref:Uncharacterized protein n=1 Tax=Catellatospora citrea TaxID=53366 RepID=A0A8J3P3A4_9ACTN|nr:hypothetical protein [Catellatospora citrea]RKE08836.1 hypothetical protein C8E86_3703 [Catellatospora citrea]GIG02461.1 hypothetical protein Cci01nite_75540 [Catellatospora citrea]
MNAPMDNLRSGLADLAGDVNPVDLRDRALRTSRRIGLRRTAVTSALSLVLLGGAGFTAVAMTGGGAPAEPATTPTVSPSGQVSPTDPAAARVAGAYYLLRMAGDTKIELHVLHESYRCGTPDPGTCAPDIRPERLRTIDLQKGDHCPWNSVAVSPDGAQVAWVVGTGQSDGSGDLMVADTRVGEAHKLATGVLCGGSRALVWTPDSRRLFIGKLGNAATVGTVDAAGGAFTPMEPQAWKEAETLASGPFRGSVRDGLLTVTEADGTAPRSVAYRDEHDMDVVVLGVSADGRFAAVSTGAGDPSRRVYVAAVVDMTTGKPVEFAVGKVNQVWFQADGSMVVRVEGDTGTLYRLDPDRRLIAEIPVESALMNAMPFQAVFG